MQKIYINQNPTQTAHTYTMLISIHNQSNGERTAVDRHAASSAEKMQGKVLEELDKYLRPNWRRGFKYSVYIVQQCPLVGESECKLELDSDMWVNRDKRNSHIKVFIDEKTKYELHSDTRRLAVAMAFDPLTSGESRLSCMERGVFYLIIQLAGLM